MKTIKERAKAIIFEHESDIATAFSRAFALVQEIANTPEPNPSMWQIFVAVSWPGIANFTYSAMLAAAPTPAEAPADVALDAARYRWLLDSNWYVGPDSFYCTGGGELEDYQNKNNKAESLDAAVDAAIAAAAIRARDEKGQS